MPEISLFGPLNSQSSLESFKYGENAGLVGGGASRVRTLLRDQFPANREKYREHCPFLRNPCEIRVYQRAFWTGNLRFCDESEQGSNRE
jgi:hypothetical protein